MLGKTALPSTMVRSDDYFFFIILLMIPLPLGRYGALDGGAFLVAAR